MGTWCAGAGTWRCGRGGLVRARERGARARRAGAKTGDDSGARGGRASRERVAVAAVRAAVRTSCVAQYCAYAQAATRS